MPSKELIEKVAREICDDIGADYDEHPSYWNNFAEISASTILAALQEPTEGMIDAYFDRCRNLGIFTHINANAAWRAMLAASALGEQSE